MMLDRPAIEGGAPVRKHEEFLVFGSPALEEPEINAVVACLRSKWIGTGPRVSEFEQAFSAYKKIEYAVAVNSCTAALHLSMMAIGIKPGDEVITTAMTFCASVNAIIHTGAKPVLADCDRDTMNISAQEIEKQITSRTKAILVVHFAGRCCDMNEIMEVSRKHGLLVVEDCAHAIETEYQGQKAGTFGDIGCFSFYVTKNLTTGEGGMVTTKDRRLAEKIKILALHGMTNDAWKRFSDDGYRHYQVTQAGFKYNMMDIQAAIGIEQLKRVELNWLKRQSVWLQYRECFQNLACSLPADVDENSRHAYHLFTLLLDLDRLSVSRDRVLCALTAENIGVGVHYNPVHLHPYYRETYDWKQGAYPNAEHIGERTLSLPLSAALTQRDVNDVCNSVSRILEYYAN